MAPAGVLTESSAANRGDGRAVEDIYQKKTQLEHILLRPDTYVGSTEHQVQLLWVHDGEKMVQRSINFVPGLYKIFDEILVNAADNKVRDPTMDRLNVDVDEVRARGACAVGRWCQQRALTTLTTRRAWAALLCGTTATASRWRCTRRRACTCQSSSLATC